VGERACARAQTLATEREREKDVRFFFLYMLFIYTCIFQQLVANSNNVDQFLCMSAYTFIISFHTSKNSLQIDIMLAKFRCKFFTLMRTKIFIFHSLHINTATNLLHLEIMCVQVCCNFLVRTHTNPANSCSLYSYSVCSYIQPTTRCKSKSCWPNSTLRCHPLNGLPGKNSPKCAHICCML